MSNSKKPLVSVLVPAYNHETYVKEAILSIVNQTYGYENIQLIVADDFSTDNTVAILSKLADDYSFKLIRHNKNIGICNTLNEMILLAEGKFITIIASDDLMHIERIEKQIDILRANPKIDILAGDCILIDEESSIISKYIQHSRIKLIYYSFEDIFLKNKPGFAAGTTIIKRDLYSRIGNYDPEFKLEDFYYWLKASFNSAIIAKCNLPFLYYRVHKKSVSSNEEFMDREGSRILEIYKKHPAYKKAVTNREFFLMSRWAFVSKKRIIKHLRRNPHLFLNNRVLKIIILLMLPLFIIKIKSLENYFRYATT